MSGKKKSSSINASKVPQDSLNSLEAIQHELNSGDEHIAAMLSQIIDRLRADRFGQRQAEINRTTRETSIKLAIDLDGKGESTIQTGVGFLDHMLNHIARHGLFDLQLEATGDVEVDDHHTVEDVGICLGQAIETAVGQKKGIRRYGFFIAPMEEAQAQVAVDLSGRPAVVYQVQYRGSKIGSFDVELVEEFLRAFANNAKMNLHVNVPFGTNNHHIAEAIFKALGKALRQACEFDPREQSIPSTKGSL